MPKNLATMCLIFMPLQERLALKVGKSASVTLTKICKEKFIWLSKNSEFDDDF
jgi:hypothetical protein